ncbi:allantoate amidohydrolase [Egicoccus sp. AB-alg2]|uniref:allantoate amidohydrolase n=1 Tax=Egicoccus sp. AB-alg2 TaxID=3242693 RepID=UPI00359E4A06
MWADLAGIGRAPGDAGGYRRFVWSDADLTLREWFVGEANARGLGVHEDRAGNLWAWWGDPTAGDAVVTGSHLDSVPSGGAFDGPLGVVSGLLAVDRLLETGTMPDRPIAVVAFSDEEGGRYGIACGGSRVLTGLLPAERALALRDDDGVTQAEALRASGRAEAAFGADPEVLRTVGTFVELHVEQGRGLVDLDAPVGVASAIRGHGRWRFDLAGRPDHAGTTRLEDRDDPMLTQARLVLAARDAAARHDAVATVGKVLVEPNAVNAVPARVQAWLDARADDDEVVRAVVAEVAGAIGVEAVEESWTPRVDFAAGLRDRLVERLGGVPVLPTGAGHDAGILASVGVPSAMVFVRNPTGVSHAPDEHAETADCLAGVDALATVLEELAWE